MAPDRYARVQVHRLTKALRVADYWLNCCELNAVAPMLKVVAELDGYHGLAAPYRRLRPAAIAPGPAPHRAPLAPPQAVARLDLAPLHDEVHEGA